MSSGRKKIIVDDTPIVLKLAGNAQKMGSVFLSHARIMAGAHHERWDGTGCPRGMAGPDIPLPGRIMAIADVCDALVSERPHKKAFTHDKAVWIIKSDSGRQFDPTLAQIFANAADRFA
jgi:putative two-component system response regulator